MIIAICTAGYAAYVTYEKLKKQNDPSLDLKGETIKSIALMAVEEEISAMEHPITTITFFDGNYKASKVVELLESNVSDVLEKHPWMGGVLAWDKSDGAKVKIFFDETGKTQMTSGHFQLYDPTTASTGNDNDNGDGGEEEEEEDSSVIQISRDKTPYKQYCAMCATKGVSVKLNYELIGKPLPFWKLSVIPDCDVPEERFAVVLSISHAVGDAHTYYQLYRTLLNAGGEADTHVEELNPYRIYDVKDKLTEKVGKREANYLWSATKKPVVDMTQKNTLSVGVTDNRTGDLSASVGIPKLLPFNKEKKVNKLFVVNNDFIQELKTKEEDVDGSSSFSTNSLMTSYFFKQNEASIGLMLVNLRQRLDDVCPELTASMAGNYTYPIVYTPEDYDKPELIQKSLKTLKRFGGSNESEGKDDGDCDGDDDDVNGLPRFRPDMAPSISVNWCNNSLNEIQVGSCQPVLHLPIWNDLVKTGHINKVVGSVVGAIKKDDGDNDDAAAEKAKKEIFPSRVSCLQLFTIEPSGGGQGEEDKKNEKLGAWVVCPESVWEKIESSGMVEKLIE